jgi:aryl sulfotransferase
MMSEPRGHAMHGTSIRPTVQHIYQNHHLDTTRWNGFKPRADDIVISTSYKAGTTLTQTIIANLLFPNGDLPGPVTAIMPWLDMRVAPLEQVTAILEAQTHRRCIKTHLALDGLPFFDQIKYVVVGRDPRDVFMSLVNHYGEHTPQFFEMMNNTPGRVGDPFPPYDGDIHKLWRNWITRGWFPWESDGYPYWSHLHHAKTWWDFRHLPNIRFVHYADLLRDLEGTMRELAAWLNIAVPEDRWPAVVDACRFETVKKNPEKVMASTAKLFWKEGPQTFFHKGTNGRWKDVLSAGELALYDTAMRTTLPPDCAKWLEQGGRVS